VCGEASWPRRSRRSATPRRHAHHAETLEQTTQHCLAPHHGLMTVVTSGRVRQPGRQRTWRGGVRTAGEAPPPPRHGAERRVMVHHQDAPPLVETKRRHATRPHHALNATAAAVTDANGNLGRECTDGVRPDCRFRCDRCGLGAKTAGFISERRVPGPPRQVDSRSATPRDAPGGQ
jgi:hypothetical protein